MGLLLLSLFSTSLSLIPILSVVGLLGCELKVQLAHMQLEVQEKAQLRQFQLEVKWLEIEANKVVRLRQLELETQTKANLLSMPVAPAARPDCPSSVPSKSRSFDVTRFFSLVPEFLEAEVDCTLLFLDAVKKCCTGPLKYGLCFCSIKFMLKLMRL